jgi:hypothetical protein
MEHGADEALSASQRIATSHAPHSTSPLPWSQLSDLVHKPSSGGPAECDEVKRGKSRRSVSEMQLEMANKGAQFLVFEVPITDPRGNPIPNDSHRKVRLLAVNFYSERTCCALRLS